MNQLINENILKSNCTIITISVKNELFSEVIEGEVVGGRKDIANGQRNNSSR
jgi:hypothetical protein